MLISQEGAELNYAEPSIKSMGFAPYSLYVLVFTFIHHFYLVLIEWLHFGNFFYFLGKVTATTGISLLLIFITEMLFFQKAEVQNKYSLSTTNRCCTIITDLIIAGFLSNY